MSSVSIHYVLTPPRTLRHKDYLRVRYDYEVQVPSEKLLTTENPFVW